MVAAAHVFIEFDDIEIAHEHAARTERFADARFVIGAVKVNVAFVGVDLAAEIYARLEPTEPENAAGDKIVVNSAVSKFVVIAAGRDAGFEDHARGLTGADALGDLVESARGAERVFDVRWRALGGGDGVAFDQLACAIKLHGRGADAHEQHAVCGLDAEALAGLVIQLPRTFYGQDGIFHGRYRRRHGRSRSRIARAFARA